MLSGPLTHGRGISVGKQAKPGTTDNRKRHCWQWIESTIISRSDSESLIIAGLLAGETLILIGVTAGALVSLFSLKGPFLQRFLTLGKTLLHWFPFILFSILLSCGAAKLAQWGEQHFRRGRSIAKLALLPIIPPVIAIFMQPPAPLGPIGGVILLMLMAQSWWYLFTRYLDRITPIDYWQILETESRPPEEPENTILDQRNYMETKKIALLERKQRRAQMAKGSSRLANNDASSQQTHTQQKYRHGHYRQMSHSLLALAVIVGIAAGGLYFLLATPRPQEAGVSKPPQAHLRFWCEVKKPEAALLADIVAAYNQTHPTEPVQMINHTDIATEINRAYLLHDLPDVLLLEEELAKRLHPEYIPLWPNQPWRQRLTLVVSPATRKHTQAVEFTRFLFQQLSQY